MTSIRRWSRFICACSGIYTWWIILLGTYSNWRITFFLWDLGPVDLFFFSFWGCCFPDFDLPTYPKAEKESGLLSIFVIYILFFCFFLLCLSFKSQQICCLQVPDKCPYNFNTLLFGDCAVFVIMLFL